MNGFVIRTSYQSKRPSNERAIAKGLAWLASFANVRLTNITGDRLRAMDEMGVDVQVLSLTAPGTQNLDAADAVHLAREANDVIADAVRRNPDRFQGFANLPTPDPKAAADELRRAGESLHLKGALIFGRTGDLNMDLPEFDPIYEAAAALRLPLYLHPQSPLPSVRNGHRRSLG